MTQTFKHQKVALRKQGIDPTAVGDDALVWFNPRSKSFEPFGAKEFKHVASGKARL